MKKHVKRRVDGRPPVASGRRGRLPSLSRLLAGVALVITAGHAGAQAIDYGALEALFGEPVTTSVTGSPQRQSAVPATMEIITAEAIRRSGARDVAGVLRHAAGLDVLQWGNDNTDFAIRGSNQAVSPRMLVLIDGRQVYADFYGFTPWAALPVELAAIRQIEIVKGPNSALFGFNAVSGVINIITFDPARDDIDAVSVTGGSQDLIQGSMVSSMQIGDAIGLRFSAGGQSNDDFSTPQRALDQGSRRGNDRGHVGLRGTFRLNDTTDLALEATHSRSDQPNVVSNHMAINEQYDSSSMEGVLSMDSRWGLVQARLYANSFTTGSDTPVSAFQYDSDVVVGQLQDLFKIGNRHTLRMAAEYRSSEMRTAPVEGARVFYNVMSFSGMWDWKLAPRLGFTNAVRFDELDLGRSGYVPPAFGLSNGDWNRDVGEVGFNSGLVWQVSDADTLRLTVARGAQLPSLADLGGTLIIFDFGYAGGNPFIDPARVLHYELSWDRTLEITGGRIRVAAFTDAWTDVITSFGPPPAPGWLSSGANIGDSDSQGVELLLTGSMAPQWSWSLGYQFQSVDDDFASYVTLLDFEHTTAEHTATAHLGWSRGAWEVDAFLRYKADFYSIEPVESPAGIGGILIPIDAYAALDARVGYRWGDGWSLALTGQNLLQSEQRQTSGAKVERQVFATLAIGF